MVLMTVMAQCRAGRHDECPRMEHAAPGEFGGVVCDCDCHFPKAAGASIGMEDRKKVELEFWLAIRNGNDPDDFRLYLQQFPDGEFAALAREKLARLSD